MDASAPDSHDEAHDSAGIDVKALRARLGWTQLQLAEYLRLDRSRISRLENGGCVRGAARKLLEQLASQLPDGPTESVSANADASRTEPSDEPHDQAAPRSAA